MESALRFCDVPQMLLCVAQPTRRVLTLSNLRWACPQVDRLVCAETPGGGPASTRDCAAAAHATQQLVVLVKKVSDLSSLTATPQVPVLEASLDFLVWAHAGLMSLTVQRSRAASDAEQALRSLLTPEFIESSTSDAARRTYARCTARVLAAQQAGSISTALPARPRLVQPLLQQLCAVVCPEKKKPVYQLLLEKSATQEEFIPGRCMGQAGKGAERPNPARTVANSTYRCTGA